MNKTVLGFLLACLFIAVSVCVVLFVPSVKNAVLSSISNNTQTDDKQPIIDENIDDRQQLIQEIENCRNELLILNDKNKSLENEIFLLNEEKQFLDSELNNANSNYNEILNRLQIVENDLSVKTNEFEELKLQLEQKQLEYDNLLFTYNQLYSVYDNLTSNYNQLQQNYDMLVLDYDALLVNYEKTNNQNLVLKSENSTLKNSNEFLNEEIDYLERRNSYYETLINDLNSELSVANSERNIVGYYVLQDSGFAFEVKSDGCIWIYTKDNFSSSQAPLLQSYKNTRNLNVSIVGENICSFYTGFFKSSSGNHIVTSDGSNWTYEIEFTNGTLTKFYDSATYTNLTDLSNFVKVSSYDEMKQLVIA